MGIVQEAESKRFKTIRNEEARTTEQLLERKNNVVIQGVIAAILVEPPRIASPKEGADQQARMMTLDVDAKLVESGRDLDRTRIAVKTIESDDDQLLGRRLPRQVATVKTVEEIDQNAAVPILQRVKVLARISDITLYIVLQRRLGISTWPTRQIGRAHV